MEVTRSLECAAAAVTGLWQYENVTVSWPWQEWRCRSGSETLGYYASKHINYDLRLISCVIPFTSHCWSGHLTVVWFSVNPALFSYCYLWCVRTSNTVYCIMCYKASHNAPQKTGSHLKSEESNWETHSYMFEISKIHINLRYEEMVYLDKSRKSCKETKTKRIQFSQASKHPNCLVSVHAVSDFSIFGEFCLCVCTRACMCVCIVLYVCMYVFSFLFCVLVFLAN